jgi:outer membrane protein assembly factor BamA
MRRCLLCVVVVCTLAVVRVGAQDRTDTANPPAVPAVASGQPSAAPAPPAIDVDDLWRLVRHGSLTEADVLKAGRRFVVVAPSIGSKPSTGFSGGFSGNMAFFAGDSATTRISTIIGGMKVSEKGQKLTGGRVAIFTADDRWFIMLDNRMAWTTENSYALGADAPLSSGANSRLDVLRLYETAYRQVRPGLFVGGGLNVSSHFNIRPGTTGTATWDDSAYVAYSEAHGFGTEQQTSSGANIGFRYDTRDNGINPDGGTLASTTYRTFFDNFLGGSSTWQEVSFDARTYRKISSDGRQKLAFWFLGDMVTGGTAPFWDLPYTSMDGRSARGYGEGRYRGESLLYWETEYRATLTRNGLLGMVVFANLTTVGSVETGERLFKTYAPAAGFGFRVLLNKRSRTNLCTDWGWGKDGSRGFYLAIQEAF